METSLRKTDKSLIPLPKAKALYREGAPLHSPPPFHIMDRDNCLSRWHILENMQPGARRPENITDISLIRYMTSSKPPLHAATQGVFAAGATTLKTSNEAYNEG